MFMPIKCKVARGFVNVGDTFITLASLDCSPIIPAHILYVLFYSNFSKPWKVSIIRIHFIDAETDTENMKWLAQDDTASNARAEVKSRYKSSCS